MDSKPTQTEFHFLENKNYLLAVSYWSYFTEMKYYRVDYRMITTVGSIIESPSILVGEYEIEAEYKDGYHETTKYEAFAHPAISRSPDLRTLEL